jgi:hypothetical protein
MFATRTVLTKGLPKIYRFFMTVRSVLATFRNRRDQVRRGTACRAPTFRGNNEQTRAVIPRKAAGRDLESRDLSEDCRAQEIVMHPAASYQNFTEI